MKIFLLFILLLSYGCSESPVAIPAEVIPQKDMKKILTDITLAQSAYGQRMRADTNRYKLSEQVNAILLRHRVEKEQFLVSLKFYGEHPEILQQVFDSVITDLSKMQGETELQQ